MSEMIWGTKEINTGTLQFEFQDDLWKGPYLSRIFNDKCYAVTDLQAMMYLSSIESTSPKFLEIAMDLIRDRRLIEIDLDLKLISEG